MGEQLQLPKQEKDRGTLPRSRRHAYMKMFIMIITAWWNTNRISSAQIPVRGFDGSG